MSNMKIKYNKKSAPLFFVIVIVLILDYHFFYLFKYPHIMGQYLSGNYLHVLLSVFSLIAVFLIMRTDLAKKTDSFIFLKKYCILIYAGWFLIIIYSILEYPSQSFIQTITEGAYILIIPLAVFILYFFYKDNGTEKLFNVLNCFYLIWCIIIIVQQIIYQKTGILIFDFDTYTGNKIRTRAYGLRLGLGVFGNLMLIYDFSKLFEKREYIKWGQKTIYLGLVAFGGYCLIFVQQTRMYMIADVIAMAIIYLLSLGKKLTSKKLILIMMLVMVVLTFINTNYFKNLLFSFSNSINNEMYASTAIRLDAYIYYLRCFIKNPLLGNGFARAEYYNYIEHGNKVGWYYYYTDTGLIGLLGNMGLLGGYIYLRQLIRMIATSITVLKKERTFEENFLVAISVWMIINSISLIVISKSGIIAYSFIIAFAEYIKDKNSTIRNIEN